jgi:putative colanic acid biosysnthesis UDP-glucose lipid carrier transferase
MLVSGSQQVSLARGRTSLVGLLRMSVDPLLIVIALVVSCMALDVEFGGRELVLALIAFSLTFPGELSARRLRRNLFLTVVTNWLLVFALLLFFGYATRFVAHFDEQVLLLWFVLTPLLQYCAHRTVPLLIPQLLAVDGTRTAVVVGANDIGRKLARSLRQEPTLGFRFLGFFRDAEQPATALGDDEPLLGSIEDVAAYAKQHAIGAVFIAMPMAAQPRLLALLEQIKDTTASVYFVPDIFIFDLIQARIDDVDGMPVVAVCETPFVGVNGLLKSVSPLLLAAAIGVKFSSPGPVFFRQRRYGLDGRDITVWKFRSMRVAEDGAEVRQATRHDSRVTPFGAFMRRTSIDELPQLFNVLQGRMSLVGPRPHAVAHNELYRRLIKGYMIRHKVRPGITGWAQVNGLRGETDSIDKMRARIDYDLEYLRRWSIGFDLMILAKTVRIVLARTNAY